MNTRFREGPDGGVDSFSPSLSVGGQAAAILFMLCFFVTISMAQVRQTSLYVDNGSGSFGQIKADSLTAGETFELPASGGTLLTNSGSGFVQFNPTDTQTVTNGNNLFNLRDLPTTGAAPGAFLMSAGNADNSGASTTGLTLFDSSAASGSPFGTVTGLSISGGYGSTNYGIVLNMNGGTTTDILGSGSHWKISSVGAATFNTSVSPTNLRGAGAGSGTTPSNKYAAQYTVDASTTGVGTTAITISNTNISGASSVVVASLVSATSVKYLTTVFPGTHTVTITSDGGTDTFVAGDKINYIIVNP